MDISLFKTFIAVAKHGSISLACKEVFLTQPAVTKQIKLLKDQYGVELFNREARRFKLTEEGNTLLNYAIEMVKIYEESMANVSNSGGKIKGTVKIATNLTLGIYVLPQLMKAFSDLYPEVQYQVKLHNTFNIIQAILDKEMKFGLVGREAKHPLVVHHPLCEENILIIFGKDLHAARKSLSWNELQFIPFLLREKGSDIRMTVDEWLQGRNIKLLPKMELNSTEAIKQCVQEGLGFSMLPRCTVEQELGLGVLRAVSAPYFRVTQQFHLLHYRDRKFSAVEKTFLEFLFEAMESRFVPKKNTSIMPPQGGKAEIQGAI